MQPPMLQQPASSIAAPADSGASVPRSTSMDRRKSIQLQAQIDDGEDDGCVLVEASVVDYTGD